MSENKKCYYCGSERFEERRVRYIYNRKGKDLFVTKVTSNLSRLKVGLG